MTARRFRTSPTSTTCPSTRSEDGSSAKAQSLVHELTLECGWGPNGYLVHQVTITREKAEDGVGLREKVVHHNDVPITPRGAHTRWYKCLETAGLVPKGTRSGQNMHRGRHTAGQYILDETGNLKAVQKFLGHSDITTTANTYVDWDEEQLAQLMADVWASDTEASS